MNISEAVSSVLSLFINEGIVNEADAGYSQWKRKNVTLRGMKDVTKDNGVWGSFGRGLYTTPLSNKSMAKQYGDVYFVVNAKPQNPKVVSNLNEAEIFRQNLYVKYCKENGHDERWCASYFENNTSIEKEMLALGYDGFVIKGREMVNYTPKNVKYFKTELELKHYYEEMVRHQSFNEAKNKLASKNIIPESYNWSINEAEYKGKKVELNKPFRLSGGNKKFAVYVMNKNGNVIKVSFGDPNLKIRNGNKEAADSFRARHKCSEKKDKTKAGYWSCNVGRYAKSLGLSSSNPW